MKTKDEKEEWSVKKASVLGLCQECKVGSIKFYRTTTMGVRFCDNCNISTYKGDTVFTQREASLWK